MLTLIHLPDIYQPITAMATDFDYGASKPGKKEMEYLINNIFLPPKLPQKKTTKTLKKERCLLVLLERAAGKYVEVVDDQVVLGQIKTVHGMLSALRECKYADTGSLEGKTFGRKVRDMNDGGNNPLFSTHYLFLRYLLVLQMSRC
jgi:hypothetical protein